ncbi:MAG: DUF4157 domain-containing protein [Nostoc desertorum CM1-VF14]|jgi:hypothetical protein|nr:DUF4157 domain-containing protein [Nostoc desertorum CM1-VF14]
MNKRSHIHKKADSSASNPVRSHLQSRPFIVQAQPQSQKPLTQTETEDQEFQQQKFEATKLKLQAKSGTITPEGQERLTVLQAKMSGSLQRKLEQASRFGHNFANIPLSRPHAPSQPVVQTKLKIGEPGDKFEKDADQFAQELDKLTHAPVPGQIEQNPQPKEMSVAEKEIQTKPMLQLRAAVGGMTATAGLETAINQARGGGQPLADNVRKPMEQFSGTDLSRVKVHTDQKADQLSRAIQARAFTTGQDIFFAKGEYKPSSREGQKLIFHEGRHVAQQNGAAVQRSPQPPEHQQSPVIQTSSTPITDRQIQAMPKNKGSNKSYKGKGLVAYVGGKEYAPTKGKHAEQQIVQAYPDGDLTIQMNAWPCKDICSPILERASENRKITIEVTGDQSGYSQDHGLDYNATGKVIFNNGKMQITTD